MYQKSALALIFFCASLEATASGIKPFRAEYVGTYAGLPIKARGLFELAPADNGAFRFTSRATLPLVSVTQSSRFMMSGGVFVPLDYRYQRKGIGANKTRSNTFDWDAATTTYTRKGDAGTYPVAPRTLDKLLYQLQLRADVREAMAQGMPANRRFTYVIADNDDLEEYTFVISGEETLSTPIGEVATARLERVRQDSARQTILWLATDHDCLPVRLRQVEKDGKDLELNLIAVTMDTATSVDDGN